MAAAHWLSRYIGDIDDIREAGNATELSYRTPIEQMLQEAAAEFGASVEIRQEPGRVKDIGAPDFLISAKDGGGVVGYVECKAPSADLQKQTTKAQVEKYRALSENILLTDSFRWLHLREGKIAADVQLAKKPDKRKREDMFALLRTFMTADADRIADSKRLAAALARRCTMLRRGLQMREKDKQSRLHGLLGEFRNTLDRDLDFVRFADIFAQTLVYSLLMAKLQAPDGKDLTLFTAREFIPANFAVIRQITSFLPDMEDRGYQNIRWIVSDILAIVNGIDKAAVAESMSYKKGVGEGDDPYLNFYETFLAEYDPKLRKSRGVYYTPPPVVKFIVRAADDLLRRDFDMPDGLAEEESVTALDFAAGTGTFMLEMARLLFDGKSKGKRDMLARGHFLKNFHGFEMMTSAYVISHLKLSRFLADNDIRLQNGERIKVWLANTLEKLDELPKLSLMPTLAHETESAQEVKNSPVLVVAGNPPYSGVSQNRGEWITDLIETYKHVDGKHFGEKKHWLQDDYVKFIRFAQWKMDQVPRGIVAVITNHAFLDNPTFRGMRQSLMNTFDALYFLDLHGNANKGEKAPGGDKDENVFDIRQGTAISLLVKNPTIKKKGVFHADLWGMREHKYAVCAEGGIDSFKWRTLKPTSPGYFFIPHDNRAEKAYRAFYSIPEIFSAKMSGIVTARDHFAIDADREVLLRRMRAFIAPDKSDAEVAEQLSLKETRGWKIPDARKQMATIELPAHIESIAYRPFDTQHIMYHPSAVDWGREKFMRRAFDKNNLGLITVRQVAEKHFNHAIVADKIVDSRMTISNKGGAYLFPLYRYENGMGALEKRENFTEDFRKWINARYGTKHTPEKILGCIYAVLHSPSYRMRYADFLQMEFPRIPFPENNNEFERLAAIGNELIAAHLLHANCTGKYGELCGDGTSHKVEKVRYAKMAGVCISTNIPPEVFNFQIRRL